MIGSFVKGNERWDWIISASIPWKNLISFAIIAKIRNGSRAPFMRKWQESPLPLFF